MNFASMSTNDLLVRLCGPGAADLLAKKPLADIFGLTVDNTAFVGSSEQRADYFAFPEIGLARELVSRALASHLQGTKELMSSPQSMKDYLRLRIGNRPHEVFGVIYLDAAHRLIAVDEMFVGTLSSTQVHPRELVKTALARNASAIVCFHNHPSGDLTPSRADENLTCTLKTALSLIDVRVIDHIIVSPVGARSMAEIGLM